MKMQLNLIHYLATNLNYNNNNVIAITQKLIINYATYVTFYIMQIFSIKRPRFNERDVIASYLLCARLDLPCYKYVHVHISYDACASVVSLLMLSVMTYHS